MKHWTNFARRVAPFACFVLASAAVAGDDDLQTCRQSRAAQSRLEACSKVIADDGSSTQDKALAYRVRGSLRSDAGAVADAIADYTRALDLAPNLVAGYAGRGLARLTSGDQPGALADYDAAVRLSPRQPGMRIARAHVRMTAGDIDGAIADLTDAISLDANSAMAYNNRGLAWRRKGDATKSEADYTAALQINPIYAQAYANRGYLYESLGRKSEAVTDLENALLLDSSLAEARQVLKRLGAADRSTAATDKLVQFGRELAEANCTRCHAIGPEGASPNPKSPEFRAMRARHPQLALREPLTRGILAQHDQMPRFPLTDAEIDAIVAYINNL